MYIFLVPTFRYWKGSIKNIALPSLRHKRAVKEGKDMDVRLNRLLNSAERFVQDKKDAKDADNNTSARLNSKQVPSSEPKSDFAVSLPIQYHNIQNRLTELQKQLSKEQAKTGLLEDSETQKDDLKKILFENEPLFAELETNQAGPFDKKDALVASQGTIKALLQELKKKEVEGENIFSLGMMLNPEEFKGKVGTLSAQAQKPISESVVKRLLGG